MAEPSMEQLQKSIIAMQKKISAMEKQIHTMTMNATTVIGTKKQHNNKDDHWTFLPAMIPMGIKQLYIQNESTYPEGAIKPFDGDPQVHLVNVFWHVIPSLPCLTTLKVDFSRLPSYDGISNLRNVDLEAYKFTSLECIVNPSIQHMTLIHYPCDTLEGLQKFKSLKVLILQESSNVKSLQKYLPRTLKRLHIIKCPSLEPESSSLEKKCTKKKIELETVQ